MLNYLLETTLCWAGFYALYALLLSRTTFFQANRWYLLGTLLLGALVPVLPLPQWSPQATPVAQYLAPVQAGVQEVELRVLASPEPEGFPWRWLLLGIYLLGLGLGLARLAVGLFRIAALYRRSDRVRREGYTQVYTEENHLPFSFFNLLFWSRQAKLDEEACRSIMRHERAHIRGWHSVDVLLVELLGTVFWCCPPVFLYRRSLRQVHEYLADQAALGGLRPRTYGKLLLQQAQWDLQLAFAHHLLQSPLKKRIHMMTRPQTSPGALLRYALALPLLILFLLAFANRSLIGQTLMEIHRPDGTVEKHQVDPDNIPENLVSPEQILTVNVTKDPDRIVVRMKPNGKGTVDIEGDMGSDQTSQVVIRGTRATDPLGPVDLEELTIVGYPPDPGAGFALPEKLAEAEFRIHGVDGRILEGDAAAREIQRIEPKQIARIDVHREAHDGRGLVEIHMKGNGAAQKRISGTRVTVEQMPRYPGCESIGGDAEAKQHCAREKMFGFLMREMRYPVEARRAGAEGVVVVEFTVAPSGAIESSRVVRGLHPSCDAEALRVIDAMPEWVPGSKDGEAVPVKLQLPFSFKIDPKPETRPEPGASRQLALNGFTASPNPSQGVLDLRFEGVPGPLTVQVTDLRGRVLQTLRFPDFNGQFNEQIDLNALADGPLLVSIIQGERIFTHRVVLQR